MDETRAVARLPQLDIEIVHRRDENAELLAVQLRAMPDLAAAAAWLDPRRSLVFWASLNPWLALNPWLRAALLPPPRS